MPSSGRRLLRFGRKELEEAFGPSDLDAPRVIQLEQRDCRPAGCGERNDAIIVPPKVVGPIIDPRIEETDRFARERIGCFDAVGLVQVTAGAGERQVVELGLPTSRSGDNVLEMEGRSLERLVHKAVFAPPACPLFDRQSELIELCHWGWRPSR